MSHDTMHEFRLATREKEELVNITHKVEEIAQKTGAKSGICTVFVPHTTAGVLINEGADPDVCRDILSGLKRIVPDSETHAHSEGNSPAHIKSCLVGCSVSVLVEEGKLALGTWQSIFFAEFDGPRDRKVWVTITKE